MKWYEYAWMIGFGIACGGLMIHDGAFNGLILIPLIPLIGKGISKVMSC